MTDTLISIGWSDTAAAHARNEAHRQRVRHMWAGERYSHALPTSQSAPGGYPGNAAASDQAAGLTLGSDAGVPLGGGGAALAGPVAVDGPIVPLPLVTEPGVYGFVVVKHRDGAWGPAWWVVHDIALHQEVARYPTVEVSPVGAILRYLREAERS